MDGHIKFPLTVTTKVSTRATWPTTYNMVLKYAKSHKDNNLMQSAELSKNGCVFSLNTLCASSNLHPHLFNYYADSSISDMIKQLSSSPCLFVAVPIFYFPNPPIINHPSLIIIANIIKLGSPIFYFKKKRRAQLSPL